MGLFKAAFRSQCSQQMNLRILKLHFIKFRLMDLNPLLENCSDLPTEFYWLYLNKHQYCFGLFSSLCISKRYSNNALQISAPEYKGCAWRKPRGKYKRGKRGNKTSTPSPLPSPQPT